MYIYFVVRSRIIDDDIDLKKVTAAEDDEVDLYPDEGPTIAGETDERPEEVRQLELYRASKQWKTLGKNPFKFHWNFCVYK